jgi:hypothetical protein
MDPENEKIQLDDISFDDVIGGDGVETVTAEETPSVKEEKEIEASEENTLDDIGIEEPSKDEIEEEEEEEEEIKEEDTSKDDLKSDKDSEESVEESTVVSEVINKLGYELDGDSYDDTPEGLANMTSDLASKMADDRIDEVLEAFPLVKKHLDYVIAGGESQNFMEAYDPNLDYSSINIEKDDFRSQKAILGDYLELRGHDNDFIEEMLNDFEDTGKLYQKAEAAKNALAKHQTQQREQMIETQRKETARKKEEVTNFWNNVSETIEDADSFAGISVPKREKGKFFEYLSAPVTKEGYTQRDIDHANAKMDVKLAIDYLMYTGFDLSDIISNKAKTQNAKTLRERISRNEDKVKSTRRSTRRSKNVDLDNLDLSI